MTEKEDKEKLDDNASSKNGWSIKNKEIYGTENINIVIRGDIINYESDLSEGYEIPETIYIDNLNIDKIFTNEVCLTPQEIERIKNNPIVNMRLGCGMIREKDLHGLKIIYSHLNQQ